MADSVGSGFPTSGINIGHETYNKDTGIAYVYIGGTPALPSSWLPVWGNLSYANLINTAGLIPADTNPALISFNASVSDLLNMTLVGGTNIVIQQKGIYLIVNGVQASKTGGGGAQQFVDMWIRKNGVDVPYSGVRQNIATANEIKVLVLNTVLRLEVGDILTKYIAVSSAGVGLGLYTYTNTVGAVIPAGIFSIMKLN